MATLANGACNAMQGAVANVRDAPRYAPRYGLPSIPWSGFIHDQNATLSGKNPVRSINRHLQLNMLEPFISTKPSQKFAEGHAYTVMPGPSLVCLMLLYSFGTGPDPFPAVPFLHDFGAAVQIFSCYCMLQSKQYGLYRSNALFRVCRFYGKIWGVFHVVNY